MRHFARLTLEHCYRVLEIDSCASIDEIKRAYRKLAKVWHPDRFVGDPELQADADEKLKQINAAYRYLKQHRSAGDRPAPQPNPAAKTTPPKPTAAQENQVRVTTQSGPRKDPAEVFYNHAIDCFQRGSYTAACSYLSDAIRLRPDYLAAYELRYEALQRKGSTYLAKQDLPIIQRLQARQGSPRSSRPTTPPPPAPPPSPADSIRAFVRVDPLIAAHAGPVVALALHSQNQVIGTVGADGYLRLRSLINDATWTQEHHSQECLTALAVSADGRWWAVGTASGRVWIWDAVDRQVRVVLDDRLTGGVGAVRSLGFLPNGSGLWSFCEWGMIRHWDLRSGRSLSQWGTMGVTGNVGPGRSMAVSPCGRYAIVGGDVPHVNLCELNQAQVRRRWPVSQATIALAFSPNGQVIGVAQKAGLKLWFAKPPASARSLVGHRGAVRAIAFAPESSWLTTTGDDRTLRFWTLSADQPLKTIDLGAAGRSLVMDRQRVICGLESGELAVLRSL